MCLYFVTLGGGIGISLLFAGDWRFSNWWKCSFQRASCASFPGMSVFIWLLTSGILQNGCVSRRISPNHDLLLFVEAAVFSLSAFLSHHLFWSFLQAFLTSLFRDLCCCRSCLFRGISSVSSSWACSFLLVNQCKSVVSYPWSLAGPFLSYNFLCCFYHLVRKGLPILFYRGVGGSGCNMCSDIVSTLCSVNCLRQVVFEVCQFKLHGFNLWRSFERARSQRYLSDNKSMIWRNENKKQEQEKTQWEYTGWSVWLFSVEQRCLCCSLHALYRSNVFHCFRR